MEVEAQATVINKQALKKDYRFPSF